jgi:hypothetical protein
VCPGCRWLRRPVRHLDSGHHVQHRGCGHHQISDHDGGAGEELVRLEAISKLHREIDKVLVNSPSTMTSATLRTLANDLRGCGRELARLGVPSDRLQPVYTLTKRGCAQYDKGAQCLATAADIPAPIPGAAAERKFKQTLDCGFKTPGQGSLLLAEAEQKGFEVKAAAG